VNVIQGLRQFCTTRVDRAAISRSRALFTEEAPRRH
jgi:hypothetical protein